VKRTCLARNAGVWTDDAITTARLTIAGYRARSLLLLGEATPGNEPAACAAPRDKRRRRVHVKAQALPDAATTRWRITRR